MADGLVLYNSLTRKKEEFRPLNPPFAGMYVCGPTVYGDPHLGHSRPAITFDVLFRYLKHLGYRVRYVSNITDVGHLEDEVAEAGEDKVARKARLEKLEPMEVAQMYTNSYHDALRKLNVLPPSIEPLASGHIIEQTGMIRRIIEAGFAYVVNGSVYFDVVKYNKKHRYGILSGRVLEDLRAGERELEAQDEKHNREDFALWKKAGSEHIMQWPSPWGNGFPGWHLECSVMGGKYLGVPFDIHGGGMDLKFPHHECEIAQSVAAYGKEPVKVWMHNNLITINGQKMSKSLGNFITIGDLFAGSHPRLERSYSPMTLRFFILQTHYRSTLDFSNEALAAASKGYRRLMNAVRILSALPYEGKQVPDPKLNKEVEGLIGKCASFMNDDLNTPNLLATLFDLATVINNLESSKVQLEKITRQNFDKLSIIYPLYVSGILGLTEEEDDDSKVTDGLMQLIISMRKTARDNGDFALSDKIRNELSRIGIQLKDRKDGAVSWEKIPEE